MCIKSAANTNFKMAAKDAQENGAIVLYDDAHSKNDYDKFILKQVKMVFNAVFYSGL